MKTFRRFLEEHLEFMFDLHEQANMLAEGAPNPAFQNDADIAALEKKVNSGAPREAIEAHVNKVMDKHEGTINNSHREFQDFVRSSTRGKRFSGAQPLTQKKSRSSIINKAVDRKKSLTGMGDLTRGAVLFRTRREVDAYVDHLRRNHANRIVDYEHKARGTDTQFGYHGSHHFTISNPSGVNSELQVMTKRLWNFKEPAHEIYNRNRVNPEATPRPERRRSLAMFTAGNREPSAPNVPGRVKRAKVRSKPTHYQNP